jgi:L-ascorbate metabolism protein UlaG (beta-lactamase superfamily)
LRVLGLALLLFVAVLLAQGWIAFGKAASGERLARMQRSPNYRGGRFVNPQPLQNDFWGMLGGLWHVSEHVSPSGPPDRARLDPDTFKTAPPSGLRVTWFGHSSILIEIDGKRVLTDPMWSERASPISWLGPKRWYPPALELRDLPALDAVVISHDHYDHLDYQTIRALDARGTRFVVPLGVGAHLEYWGVPAARIVELDWWEKTELGELGIVATPARHASGRFLTDKDATLWAGYAFVGPRHRAYYSGDTGSFPALGEIGERLGPFDVTLIEAGQYHRSWPDWHIGPEQAVRAHELVRGKVMLPVHWALLGLAYHGWTEPIERTVLAAGKQRAQLLTPRPGQAVEPTQFAQSSRWWPDLPWESAEQSPVVSTQN